MQTQQVATQTNMLDLLMAQDQAPTEVVPVVIVTSPQNNIPKQASINSLFKMYANLGFEISAKIEESQQIERELLGTCITDGPSFKSPRSYGDAALESLLRRAQHEFAPPNIDLKIKREEVLDATGQSDWNERAYYRENNSDLVMDLDKVWKYLVAKYSGDQGKKIVLSKVAERIIYHFNMQNQSGITRTASHVACSQRIYSEKKYNSTEYGVGYNYQKGVFELFNALQAFAEHAELDQLSIQLAPVRHGICDYHYSYPLRNKVSFAGMDLVMQKEAWIYKFSHEVAQKLMLFLGEFGQSED